MSVKQYSSSARMDYGKLTVAKLKDELKSRGIPSTGLTRKQHFIDRLVQEDAQSIESSTLVAEPAAESIVAVESPSQNNKHEIMIPVDTNDKDGLVKGTPDTILQAEQAARAVDPQSTAPAVEILAAKANEVPEARLIDQVDDASEDASSQSSHGEHTRKRGSHALHGAEKTYTQKRLKHDNTSAIVSEQDIDKTAHENIGESTNQSSSILHKSEPGTSQLAPVDCMDIDERPISPSLHPATTALYIRNLKRPIQQLALRQHLVALAKEDDSIRVFHIDAIRTHAFVQFSSTNTASRVRSGLHEHVWPAERDRETLWVDFVPEDKLGKWIETESRTESTNRGAPAQRWEVIYSTLEDGSVATKLQPSSQYPPSAGPQDVRSVPEAVFEPVQPNPTSFLALDKLFRSTVAKPKLYWAPVEPRLVDDRLAEVDALTTITRSYPKAGSGLSDSRRYTFEDGDRLVDNGPEFGLRGSGLTRGDGGRGRGQIGRRSGDRWR